MRALGRRGISSPAVRSALEAVPREGFLPENQALSAYEDRALPIGLGQTCSQPWMVAAIAQALDLRAGARVLEVGAGSGYLAAVLCAAGAAEVVALEIIPELAARARDNLNRQRVRGVEVRLADGRRGAPDRAPFAAVVVSAATPEIPPALLEQVAIDGCLVCPVVEGGEERLWLWRRHEQEWCRRDLGACRFVPLLGEG